MERTSDHPLFAIAIAAMSSKKGGSLVEEACRLVIADLQFNRWVASTKQGRAAIQLTEDGWVWLSDAVEEIYAKATRAWKKFEATDWPRGQFDVWRQSTEECKRDLDEARASLDQLGRDLGRAN